MKAGQKQEPKASSGMLQGIKFAIRCCSSSTISIESSPRRPRENYPILHISDDIVPPQEYSDMSVLLGEGIQPKATAENSNSVEALDTLVSTPIEEQDSSEVMVVSDIEHARSIPLLDESFTPIVHWGRRRLVRKHYKYEDEKFDHNWLIPKHVKKKNGTQSNPRKWSNWDSLFEGHSRMEYSRTTRDGSRSAMSMTNETDDTWVESEVSRSVSRVSVRDKLTDVSSSEAVARDGEVFLLYLSKIGMRFTWVPLNMQLETVARWLNEGAKNVLPISYEIFPRKRDLRWNFLKLLTIKKAFGDRLDSSKDGINFFVGPVDGHISFKMSICDLYMLQRMSESRTIKREKKDTKEDNPEKNNRI